MLHIFDIYEHLHNGVVLKQLNYPISTLPILFRFVDRIVNDHYRSFKFPNFYWFNKFSIQNSLTKKRRIINIKKIQGLKSCVTFYFITGDGVFITLQLNKKIINVFFLQNKKCTAN